MPLSIYFTRNVSLIFDNFRELLYVNRMKGMFCAFIKLSLFFLVLSYLSPRYILGNTSSEILRQLAAWRSINKVQSVAMEYKWCSFVSSWKVRFEQFSTLYLHCRHLLMHFGECKKHLFKQIELSVLVPSRSLSLHILIDSLSELKDDLALYDSRWK